MSDILRRYGGLVGSPAFSHSASPVPPQWPAKKREVDDAIAAGNARTRLLPTAATVLDSDEINAFGLHGGRCTLRARVAADAFPFDAEDRSHAPSAIERRSKRGRANSKRRARR